jgi:hypothetical protein
MVETENPKEAYGALKPCASYAPMNVMLGVYRVFELGAKKYGRKNWRKQPVDISTYYNAAQRHLIEFFEQRIDADPESGQSPLAHVIACCMIILDGIERGEIKDDRGLTEVLTGKALEERMRKNIAYAGGDVPVEAQPQIKVCTDDPMARVPDFKTSGVSAARGAPKDF